jgi:tRNA modification GTPase
MTRATLDARVTLVTPPSAGAVAILHVAGPDAVTALRELTGRRDWPSMRLRLVDLARIDEGLAGVLGDDLIQLMPHGGPLVVSKLLERLSALGVRYDADPPVRQLYPEASCELEAWALHTMARAASPMAVDHLAAQTALWRQWLDTPAARREPIADILARSDQLDRLVMPPSVVVAGPANVGKSTLTNRLLGRNAALVADLPGTTRDWIAGLTTLAGLAIRWTDTPGLRPSADPLEQHAIALAAQVIAQADLLIVMRDPWNSFPDAQALGGRAPDLTVFNKIDTLAASDLAIRETDHTHALSAATGQGVEALVDDLVRRLIGDAVGHGPPRRWAFAPILRQAMAQAPAALPQTLSRLLLP